MCGIVGIYDRDIRARIRPELVSTMTDRLVHRGPDDGGVVALGPACLGHRRLSILDLTPAGHQPMGTDDGRYWITYNGEVYNYRALRADLEARGERFRTRTDTEVVLALYRREGTACLDRLNGMFALAIYDRREHTLFLARDRLGQKPLYVWDDGVRICFASELKALTAIPGFPTDIDTVALADYLAMLYVPDPRTIYRGVAKLPPAHAMWVTPRVTRRWRYWRVPLPPPRRRVGDTESAYGDALAELEALLEDAVKLRMVADVPLGAFLSGGVDSSLVVSEMCRHTQHPVRTTTIGFSVPEDDESPFALEVATRLGCDHHTEPVEADAASLVETLLHHFDEPFADSSALPTYLLSKATRARVTVALSGDGGDEVFGGYEKYLADQREHRLRGLLPASAWQTMAGLARRAPWSERLAWWTRGVHLLETLGQDPARAYLQTQSFVQPALLFRLLSDDVKEDLGGHDPGEVVRQAYLEASHTDPLTAAQATDLATSLPGDMLVKVDRMSMAHALEVRCPLLDHRLVAFGLRLPAVFRLHRREGKRLLKRLLEKRLPRHLVHRPKHGFTIPYDTWFRGPLLSMAKEIILEGGLADSGLLDMSTAAGVIEAHGAGKADHGNLLWTLLALGVWYDRVRTAVEPAVRVAGAAPTVVTTAGPGFSEPRRPGARPPATDAGPFPVRG